MALIEELKGDHVSGRMFFHHVHLMASYLPPPSCSDLAHTHSDTVTHKHTYIFPRYIAALDRTLHANAAAVAWQPDQQQGLV